MEKMIDRFLNLLMAVSVAAFTAVMLAYIARYDLGFSREEIRTFAVIAAAVGVALVVIESGRMTNSSYFLPGLLTGHGNAISGRVGVVQFPKASLDPRLQNI